MQCGSTGCAHTGGGGTLHGIANTRAQRTHLPCPLQTHEFQLVRRAQVVPEKRHQHRQLPTHTHTHTHSTHTANTGPHLTKRGEGGGLGGTTSRADLRGV